MECPFCSKEIIEKQKIHETEFCYVLYNSRPANKGQCLIVPKRHVGNVKELTDEEATDVILTVQDTARRLEKYLRPEGFNYGFNEGKHSGQSVPHFHFHIMPRILDDTLQEFHLFHRDPTTKKEFSAEELKPFIEEFKKIF